MQTSKKNEREKEKGIGSIGFSARLHKRNRKVDPRILDIVISSLRDLEKRVSFYSLPETRPLKPG